MSYLSRLSAFTLTPFSSAGVVDVNRLQRLVARLAATGIDSIGVLGSTGSYMYLSRAQRARAIAAAVEACGLYRTSQNDYSQYVSSHLFVQ